MRPPYRPHPLWGGDTPPHTPRPRRLRSFGFRHPRKDILERPCLSQPVFGVCCQNHVLRYDGESPSPTTMSGGLINKQPKI